MINDSNFFNYFIDLFSRLFDIFYQLYQYAIVSPYTLLTQDTIAYTYTNPYSSIIGDSSVRVGYVNSILSDNATTLFKGIIDWLQELPVVGSSVSNALNQPLILCILYLFGLLLFVIIAIKFVKLLVDWR